MSKPSEVQKSVERMKIYMELRGLRPNTAYTFAHCALRFLAHVGKPPATVTTKDVEGFLLELAREGRSPRTRNVMLSPRVLEALRTYWKAARPAGPELFPGGHSQRPGTRLARESINRMLAKVDYPLQPGLSPLARQTVIALQCE
jgi:integrase